MMRYGSRTPLGCLASSLWTSSLTRGEQLALRLAVGHTAINGISVSDPRLPFGGVKESGYSRELSRLGLHEFVNAQSIVWNVVRSRRRPAVGHRVIGRRPL